MLILLFYKECMDHELTAKRLSELGHVTRLAIFRHLVKAGDKGLAVGQLQRHLNISAPNLSHHLHRMIGVGLVQQVRRGRVLLCFAELDVLRNIVAFLDQECCTL